MGLFLPMSVEVVAGFYAICKIGAIAVPIFSGFGAPAVAARLRDAGAVALLTADAVPRRGRPVSMKEVADEALEQAPSVRQVVVWDRLGTRPAMRSGRDHHWHELVASQSAELPAPPLDPEAPMMVIYTSGTTGRPKGAVHVHGGFLVKIAEECAFQTDVAADDRFMWVTDMGWIMGPWEVVGAGALGATLVLSEGAPDYPGPGRLWQLVERHRISVLGVSPTLIRALRGHGDEQVLEHDRSSLRILASTGEPWNPDPYRWLFEVVGERRCPIINLSGGTEVARLLPVADAGDAAQGVHAGRALAGHGDGRAGARRQAGGAGRGGRAGVPQAVAVHDPRHLGRPPSATSTPTGRAGPGSGCTATGRRSTRTATGTCTGAPTTPSTSPASGSARPSSSRRGALRGRGRGLCDRRAGRAEGRGGMAVLRAADRRRAERRAAGGRARGGRCRAGQGLRTRPRSAS